MFLALRSTGCAAILTALGFMSTVACAAPVPAVLERPAARIERVHTRAFLALGRADSRIVAVGERGLIALSDDSGKTWKQADCPVSVTLTGVTFADAKTGWAIGHAGTILHTEDGGQSWRLQLDGTRAARIVEAHAKTGGADVTGTLSAVANQLVADGPDKPFLDLQFSDALHGIVVGPYGLIFRTDDGGKNWQSMMHKVPNPKGLHLYAVRMSRDSIWVAGEQGFLARSIDGGKSFTRIETPYRGTYFTMTPVADSYILGGLKGNAFRVDRGATNFHRVEGAPPVSFSASAVLRDGVLAFANQAGQIMVSTDGGETVVPISAPSRGPLSALQQAPDGSLVTAGLTGLDRVTIPSRNVATNASGK
jgi:photosystem II stability/assembly factor-like uncharacterized protein